MNVTETASQAQLVVNYHRSAPARTTACGAVVACYLYGGSMAIGTTFFDHDADVSYDGYT